MFTTKDPLGRDVVLRAKTWNVHIINRHTEMQKQESLVKKTIEHPKFILPDIHSDTRQNYFEICHFPVHGCLSLLKVVVDFSASTGDVITAYPIMSTQAKAITKRGVIYERP